MWPMHVNTHHFWGRRTCVPDGNCVDAIFYDWAWLSMDGVLTKVPLFRAVYRPVSQVVRLFAGSNADLTGLPVVMCRLGGEQGVDVPAFLASSETFTVAGEPRLLVYLPTSPLPAWGGLVLDADALIKLYFSFGVLAPETLPSVIQKQVQKTPVDA